MVSLFLLLNFNFLLSNFPTINPCFEIYKENSEGRDVISSSSKLCSVTAKGSNGDGVEKNSGILHLTKKHTFESKIPKVNP